MRENLNNNVSIQIIFRRFKSLYNKTWRGATLREVQGCERCEPPRLRGDSIVYEVHLLLFLIVSLCVRSTPFYFL